MVGAKEGLTVGSKEGTEVEGVTEGPIDGPRLGTAVGLVVGVSGVGFAVGTKPDSRRHLQSIVFLSQLKSFLDLNTCTFFY